MNYYVITELLRNYNVLSKRNVLYSYLIRGLVYERIDIGNLKYCLQMQQNLPPEEWIVLMQQIVDGTEACFHMFYIALIQYLYNFFLCDLFRVVKVQPIIKSLTEIIAID